MNNQHQNEIHTQKHQPETQLQPQQEQHPAPRGGGILRSMFNIPLLGLGVIFLLIYELTVPDDASLMLKVARRIGTYEAKILNTTLRQEADYQYAIKTAMDEVERLTQAYSILYSMNAEIAKTAYQMEAQLFQQQLISLDSAQTIDKVGTNLAGIACLMSKFGGGYGTSSACRTQEAMQDNLLARQKELLTKHRSQIPKNIIEGLPQPQQLLSPEFRKLAEKYPS
jgi:hypothetical protein